MINFLFVENGIYLFLWLGSKLPNEWIANVFGVSDSAQIGSNIFKLPEFDNVYSKKIHSLITHVQNERRRSMKVSCLPREKAHHLIFNVENNLVFYSASRKSISFPSSLLIFHLYFSNRASIANSMFYVCSPSCTYSPQTMRTCTVISLSCRIFFFECLFHFHFIFYPSSCTEKSDNWTFIC